MNLIKTLNQINIFKRPINKYKVIKLQYSKYAVLDKSKPTFLFIVLT